VIPSSGVRADEPVASWDDVWASALDELELTLEATQRLLAGGDPAEALDAAPWAPPSIPVPLPSDLVARAQGLLARQQELMGLTVAAMAGNRRDAVAIGKVSGYAGTARTEPAVYLDLHA
jgi:hypothetical protein